MSWRFWRSPTRSRSPQSFQLAIVYAARPSAKGWSWLLAELLPHKPSLLLVSNDHRSSWLLFSREWRLAMESHLRHILDLGSNPNLTLSTDPMILNQWYQLHMQRLQTTVDQFPFGLQHYLAQGMKWKNLQNHSLIHFCLYIKSILKQKGTLLTSKNFSFNLAFNLVLDWGSDSCNSVFYSLQSGRYDEQSETSQILFA